jgi:CubicO group peptidase (beta-lactamase class C family)
MAWKRSPVRSRPGPPYFQSLTNFPTNRLVAFGSKLQKHFQSAAKFSGFALGDFPASSRAAPVPLPGGFEVKRIYRQLALLPSASERNHNFEMSFRPCLLHIAFRASFLCVVLAITATSTFSQTDRTKLAEQEDAYISAEAAHFFRGDVLVGINGRIVFEKAYGMGDEEWGTPNTLNTKFRIASLSKQFTSACILLLQERGRLNVHDPISRYLTGLPEAWQAITIHQLLTHTSGIPNYTSSPDIAKLNRAGAMPQQMIALVADKPLDFKPATNWSYSNTGYILLGVIIEKVSGQPYANFLQSNVFEPLRMEHSGYDRAKDIIKERASGYGIVDGHVANSDFIDMSIPFSAGGIYSTVEDMYRWNEAVAEDGKLSSPRTVVSLGLLEEKES